MESNFSPRSVGIFPLSHEILSFEFSDSPAIFVSTRVHNGTLQDRTNVGHLSCSSASWPQLHNFEPASAPSDVGNPPPPTPKESKSSAFTIFPRILWRHKKDRRIRRPTRWAAWAHFDRALQPPTLYKAWYELRKTKRLVLVPPFDHLII